MCFLFLELDKASKLKSSPSAGSCHASFNFREELEDMDEWLLPPGGAKDFISKVSQHEWMENSYASHPEGHDPVSAFSHPHWLFSGVPPSIELSGVWYRRDRALALQP